MFGMTRILLLDTFRPKLTFETHCGAFFFFVLIKHDCVSPHQGRWRPQC